MTYFQVIPARGTASVNVNFTPFPTGQVSMEMDAIGFALGFMSLDSVSYPGNRMTEFYIKSIFNVSL